MLYFRIWKYSWSSRGWHKLSIKCLLSKEVSIYINWTLMCNCVIMNVKLMIWGIINCLCLCYVDIWQMINIWCGNYLFYNCTWSFAYGYKRMLWPAWLILANHVENINDQRISFDSLVICWPAKSIVTCHLFHLNPGAVLSCKVTTNKKNQSICICNIWISLFILWNVWAVC